MKSLIAFVLRGMGLVGLVFILLLLYPPRIPIKVQLIGLEDPSLQKWVEEEILPEIQNHYFLWDGKITFGEVPKGYSALSYFTIEEVPFFRVHYVRFSGVTISNLLSGDQIKQSIRKEVLGTYRWFNWWLSNPVYVNYDDTGEVATLTDGFGYLAIDHPSIYGIKMPPWDGKSAPTCEQLAAVKALYEVKAAWGTGVDKTIDTYCNLKP